MGLVIFGMVKSSNMLDYLSNWVAMLHQIWLIGSTFSDLLIAYAMLYHVCSFWLLYMRSFEAHYPIIISQLRRMRANDGDFSNHVFVSIVRLTVETNLVTSKDPDLWCHNVSPSHAHLATVSVVSLLMVALFPVSGPVCDVHPLALDWRVEHSWRTGICARMYPTSTCHGHHLITFWV